jgi:hypothetical protein
LSPTPGQLAERPESSGRRFDGRRCADDHAAEVRREEDEQSDDLERLRLLLFPRLSRDEGRRRIAAALDGAVDADRAERIEALAADPDLVDEIFRRLPRDAGNGSS